MNRKLEKLILASQSPSRKQLLERFQIPFSILISGIDETPKLNESPKNLVSRLSYEKAYIQAKRYPRHVIIGSDTLAVVGNTVYGKPGNYQNTFDLLMHLREKRVDFLCGVCLLLEEEKKERIFVEKFSIWYRHFTEAQIKRYLKREQPFNCSGGLMFESLGIAFLEKSQGSDPTAVQGLPLMWLAKHLPEFGVNVL